MKSDAPAAAAKAAPAPSSRLTRQQQQQSPMRPGFRLMRSYAGGPSAFVRDGELPVHLDDYDIFAGL